MNGVHTQQFEPVEPRARPLIEVHPQDDGTDDDNLASSILSNEPKLSTKHNVPQRSEEVWTIRQVPNGEEELYAKGKCVYWTRNSLIIKSFNFTDQVTKVFWARFEGGDHVCIALVSGLSIFDSIGQHFQILLPFAYKEMYPTQRGLIIERACDPSDDSSLPILFALTHPTREITPIIFKPVLKNPYSKVLSYSMPNFSSIVNCHDKFPYCLMYNSQDGQHSIWKIRETISDEMDQLNNQETTANTLATSLNMSSRHKSSLLQQSNPSSARHSVLGNLAASRLGAGCGQLANDPNTTSFRSLNSAHTFNTMSTPNKNRIINYLRDNIEEPILPELTLEQVWLDATSSPQASKFFWTTDLIGDNFVVIVVPSCHELKVMKCDKFNDNELSLARATYIAADDAAPIDSLKMMLVIDVNRNYVLYSGPSHITLVTQQSTSNFKNLPISVRYHNFDMSPIQASSSARKRFSATSETSIGSELSFYQMLKSLSPVPHAKHESKTSSPICSGDAKKIEHIIGKTVYLLNNTNQRLRVDIPPICQTELVKRLLDSIQALVSKDLGIFIVSKWYQHRRASSQPEFMKADDELDLLDDWLMSSIGLENLFPHKNIAIVHSSPAKKSRRSKDLDNNPIRTNLHSIFIAMHLVFEDLLLTKLNYKIAYRLARLLLVLACLLKLRNYQDYYWQKFPKLLDLVGARRDCLENMIPKVETLPKPAHFFTNLSSVNRFLNNLITLSSAEHDFKDVVSLFPYPNIVGITNHSFTVISLFCEMFQVDRSKAILPYTSTRYSSCYFKPIGLTNKPQRSPQADIKVVELMVELGKDRDYLARLPEGINLYLWDAILNCRDSPPPDWSKLCFELIGRMDLVDLVRGRSDNLPNGVLHDVEDATLKLLFPDDIRISEAHRMLASDVPVEFSVVQRQGATEEESRDETHRQLYLLNVRTMAMPVGRGAICLRTYSPVIGESFDVPRLELSGRALPEDRPIEYNHDVSVYPWPFFHNGVAAGLTICAATASNIIDSTWINYNRPRSNIPHLDMRDRDSTAGNINNEHAGFLFALGLNGHLEKLSLMALHDYLCQNNDLTKLAILLGMAAAKRGSKDVNIIKVLSIHVDALLPPNSTELDVSAPVHAASIIGVGLLYQGSGDSHISRVLLEEIGRLPGPETNSHIDRESYSLSAGLAFGLVNLSRGGLATISSSDQLRLYMLGGKRKSLTASQKERYFKQDCHRGEEEYINTHITSPGGTLGLGLMYHKTANESVASWMRAPDTQTLLEYVRPDFLILRMLSYGLIMWNEVKPSEDYINSHIPKIVSTHAFQRNSAASPTAKLVATTASNSAIDYELISQAYCNIVTGCCMAIAMRYAGTADPDAYKTIYKHTKMLIALSNKPALVEQAGRPCVESCLNVLVTSLAVVMAGTGDLGVMRVCRYLRSRLTQGCVFYGSYMAIHNALGILFLGACRYSLSNSPESIAALVCALYPIYPNHSSDNRYHLQALRHLYVLAAEPRLLIPKDILTNAPVYVNLTVKKRCDAGQEIELQLRAPCLMPEVDSIVSVCVHDERYWRIDITNKESLLKCLFQDKGYLSVKQKAHSSNNQLVQNIETVILQNTFDGEWKSRKASALSECVREDRVEQYSALNHLIGRKEYDSQFLSLILEQLHLAMSLRDDRLNNKINLLHAVVGQHEERFADEQVELRWLEYIDGQTDWTNTPESVAHYVALNDMKCDDPDEDLISSLRMMSDFN